ncbi:MAG: poly(3-hydroxybutyrate) depolymerase [Motiliproteus sp.]
MKSIYWIITLLCLSAPGFAAPALPGMGTNLDQTSVSGISSGGFMAAQLHVVYSTHLIGAGIVAGGPYFCADSSRNPFMSYLATATTTCMNPCKNWFSWAKWMCEATLLPNGARLADKAIDLASDGVIDPTGHLANDKVYLFSGGLDDTVVTGVVDQTKAFYRSIGVPDSAIKFDQNPDAQHAYISDDSNKACGFHGAPYINDCQGYDQSRIILEHIYGPLKNNAANPSGTLFEFDQAEFVPEQQLSISALADKAYAYVPKDCEQQSCRVHVAFHGCKQSAAEYETNKAYFHEMAGYNEVADTNQIIVLYPQIRARAEMNISPFNPKGCWDFWGYTNSDFYKKESIQMTSVMKMVERLTEARLP